LRGFPVARPELITGKRLLGNNRPYVDLEQLTETLKDPSQKGFWQKKDTPLPPKGLRTVVWRDWQSYLPSPFQGRECTKKPPREGDADLHWDKDQWHKNFATLMEVLYKGLRQAESKEKVQFLLLGGEYHLAKQEPVWGQNRDDGHLSVFLYDGSNDRVLWQGRQDLSLKAHESAVDAILFSMKKALRGGTSVIRVPSLSVPYRVYVNERYIGRAPCSVSHLKEGSYKVSLRYQFRSPREIQVNLGSDEERVITPPRPEQQQAPSGALDVRATPMAHVYVNGKYVGQTPLNQKIASGHHRLRLEREGYQTREQGLFLARGERAKISWQLKKQEGDDGRDRSYQVYEPYQGWNFFRNGSTYELAGKYALAFSVLSFTAAIVADGLGKRKVDSREDTTKVNENPYQVYTSVFLTSGLSSLLASGVFLYISLSLDDGGFADYSQPGFSRAKAYGGEPKIPWIREKGRSSVRAHLSLTRRF
jgi:hypothetical protein